MKKPNKNLWSVTYQYKKWVTYEFVTVEASLWVMASTFLIAVSKAERHIRSLGLRSTSVIKAKFKGTVDVF